MAVLLPRSSGQNAGGRGKRPDGRKAAGHHSISGAGMATTAGAERPTRCIKCHTALCGVHTRPI
nr:MAG TPA: hypothetical protein [Caudoviricetes sp.]